MVAVQAVLMVFKIGDLKNLHWIAILAPCSLDTGWKDSSGCPGFGPWFPPVTYWPFSRANSRSGLLPILILTRVVADISQQR